MSKSTFWKTEWFCAAVLSLLTALAGALGAFQTLENGIYDAGFRISGRVPSDRIAIVAIDRESLAQLGTSAWSSTLQARLTDILSSAPAKVIANGIVATSDHQEVGYSHLRQIADLIAPVAPDGEPYSSVIGKIARVLAEAELQLNGDQRLAESYAKAASVLLPMWSGGTDAEYSSPSPPAGALLAPHRVIGKGVGAMRLNKLQLPREQICRQVAGIGYLAATTLVDTGGRRDPLLFRFQDDLFPSFALLVAAHALDLGVGDIEPVSRRVLRLGRLHIPTGSAMEMNPFQYPPAKDGLAFSTVSLIDVLSGKIPSNYFVGKVVLIGLTVKLPGLSQDVSIIRVANSVSSILQSDWIATPAWGKWAGLAVLLVVGIYLGCVVPRLSSYVGWFCSIGSVLVLMALQLWGMLGAGCWLSLTAPMVLLLGGHACLLFLRRNCLSKCLAVESQTADYPAGVALMSQGSLDLAFEKFRNCSPTSMLLDSLYKLAQDYESLRHVSKAAAVYQHLAQLEPGYRDIDQRLRLINILPDNCLVEDERTSATLLGRYQLERVIGQGAMGVVYLGRDLKISRVVAIKTMDLAQEFEADELVEVRQRFFREAETAGRLNHPNIVTIYDAGEENGLAYIAMEFLEGRDLVEQTKLGRLLPLSEALAIVAQVADALDYAHRNSVVHRDIKPANIMYLPEAGQVKVMDFGIARITDSSRTRAGMVLGTPSYMSPEQLAGTKVDGRSDLYSLTVMLYQLSCGQLPFVGESLAQLMYKITNEPPVDISAIDPGLPPCVLRVIGKGLSKNVAARFQNGAEMAVAIRACLNMLGARAST